LGVLFWQHWYQGALTAWATSQPFFVMSFHKTGSLRTICLNWVWITILLIFASWVVRITGVGHQCWAWRYSLLRLRNSFLFLVCWAFLLWIGIRICQMLFLHQLVGLYDFSSLVCWFGVLYWFSVTVFEPAFASLEQIHSVMENNFIYLLIIIIIVIRSTGVWTQC
jgi:hypothetical protein